jgi:prepilin-type N-terminal cleavage/methylation domain-containing protein
VEAVVRRLKGVVRRSDDGFSLVEVIVALALLAVITMPASLLFIQSMQTSKMDEQRQSAAMIANETLEVVRSRNPTTLMNGRKATDVDTQWKNPGPINLANTNDCRRSEIHGQHDHRDVLRADGDAQQHHHELRQDQCRRYFADVSGCCQRVLERRARLLVPDQDVGSVQCRYGHLDRPRTRRSPIQQQHVRR